jgi:hypothetical protein
MINRISFFNIFLAMVLLYPIVVKAGVRVSATVSKSADTLVYEYTVYNVSPPSRSVDDFAVEYAAGFYYGAIPASRISPIGWWGMNFADTAIFGWASHADSNDISPDDSLSGFKFLSFGLPAILNSYTWYFEEPQQGEGDGEPESIWVDAIVVRTISPRIPPNPFDVIAFVDSLIVMKNEAKSLGWIRSGDLSDQIDHCLDQVRVHLRNGKNELAKARIRQCLSAVRQRTAHLTTEADALLNCNLEYLINHLAK